MSIDVERLEAMPTRVSMRLGALQVNGGDLYSLYFVKRWDGGGESRARQRHACRKDLFHLEDIQRRAARAQTRALFGKD